MKLPTVSPELRAKLLAKGREIRKRLQARMARLLR